MGLTREEALPERRDFSVSNGWKARRGRRLGRLARRRFSAWAMCLVLLFLVYLFFFNRHFSSRSSDFENASEGGFGKENYEVVTSMENVGLRFWNSNNPISSAEGEALQFRMPNDQHNLMIPTPEKPKHRKRYAPCKIAFAESVSEFIEPEEYMNFTQFSLEYIDKEDNPYGHNTFEPRFGGHQTLEEREKSFYSRNQKIHCGFVKGAQLLQGSGFDLDEVDMAYMHSCKVVVSSCIFGNSDFLRRPTSKKISEYSKKNVCFVMFMDVLTMKKLYLEGQVPSDDGYIGLWRIVIVRNLPYTDMRKTGKVPKFLSHRLFPSSRFSIWIDSKMRLNTDPMLILEYFLWRKRSEYAISNHYDRHCVWDEVLQNKRLNKYNHSAIDEQFNFYQNDGLVKFNASDKNVLLPSYVPEGSFIVRAHTPMSNLFSCLWFNEVDRFTSRDQLSFAYTFLKLRRMNPEKAFSLNMFMDCERRSLAKLFHHRESNGTAAFVF